MLIHLFPVPLMYLMKATMKGGAQANTVIRPGTEFGPQFTNHFRINFSQDKTKAIAAIERVVEFAKRYRKA